MDYEVIEQGKAPYTIQNVIIKRDKDGEWTVYLNGSEFHRISASAKVVKIKTKS